MPFTQKDIEKLKERCKIRGYTITPVKGKAPIAQKESKPKQEIDRVLSEWCKNNLLSLHREYRFTSDRRWRFDWAIINHVIGLKVAFEYEGIYSTKSRHTTTTGFNGDVEKYNRAAQEGWKVLRFTADNYRDLAKELEKLLIKN